MTSCIYLNSEKLRWIAGKKFLNIFHIFLDEFTVMPNHIHGIFVIHDLSKHFHIDQNKIDDDFVETIFNRSIQFVRILDSIDYITKRLNLLTTQRL